MTRDVAFLAPEARLRATYYLLFTLLGLFHAEVLSRSQPWVLVNPLMFAIVAPVYGVHYLVFGDLLLRKRIQGWIPIFLFGCLLGLYEFVITKVFWVPPWDPAAGAALGFAWFEVIWIGFAWHAFMSFAIPYFLMQRVFLPGADGPWKSREVRWIGVGCPLFAAAVGIGFGGYGPEILVSILVSLAVIWAVAFVFMKKATGWGYRGPDDLVLGARGRKVALVSMLLVYLVFGLTMRLESVPLNLAILAPLPFYALIIALLYPHLRASPAAAQTPTGAPPAEVTTAAPAAPDAPGTAAAAPASAFSPARAFLVRYGAMFALVLTAVFVLWVVAAPLAFVLALVLIAGATVGALASLGLSARAVWIMRRTAAPTTQ